MKSILSLVLYTATALAQGIYIESPAAGTELKAGETITVQIGRPVRSSHSPPLHSLRSTPPLHHTYSLTHAFFSGIGIPRKHRRNWYRHRYRILLRVLRMHRPRLGYRKSPIQRPL